MANKTDCISDWNIYLGIIVKEIFFHEVSGIVAELLIWQTGTIRKFEVVLRLSVKCLNLFNTRETQIIDYGVKYQHFCKCGAFSLFPFLFFSFKYQRQHAEKKIKCK